MMHSLTARPVDPNHIAARAALLAATTCNNGNAKEAPTSQAAKLASPGSRSVNDASVFSVFGFKSDYHARCSTNLF